MRSLFVDPEPEDWGVEDDPQWLVTDYVDGDLVFTEAVWAFFGTDLRGDGSIHTGFMNCGLTYDFVSTFDPTTMQPTTLETITGEENPELCVG